MKNIAKTLTVSAITALVAVTGISVAQTNSTQPTPDATVSSTPAPAKPGGLKSLPTLSERLDGSGGMGSRHDPNLPAVAPVATTVTDSSAMPAATTSTAPAAAAQPAADNSTPTRAPLADRN